VQVDYSMGFINHSYEKINVGQLFRSDCMEPMSTRTVELPLGSAINPPYLVMLRVH
jgi:hypothetical protein